MCPASCGISTTGLCIRCTMSWFTCSRSSPTRAVSAASDGRWDFRSSCRLTMTAKLRLPAAVGARPYVRDACPFGASIVFRCVRSSCTGGGEERVKELLRSNDPVLLSWAQALLAAASIDAIMLDIHSSILDGSISAVPRRLMVDDDDYATARRLIG